MTLRQNSHSILLGVPGAFHQRRTTDVIKCSLLDDGEDRRTLSGREMTSLDTEGSLHRGRLREACNPPEPVPDTDIGMSGPSS